MSFDLSKIIDIEANKFKVENAIYFKKRNKLYLTIISEQKDEKLEEILKKKFSFVDLEINYKIFDNTSLDVFKEQRLKEIKKEIDDNKQKAKLVKENVEKGLHFGKKISEEIIDIKDIFDKKGIPIAISGRIFELSSFVTQKNTTIYTFDLEDETDAVACKIFVTEKNKDKFSALKNGISVEILGTLNYDSYQKEDVIQIRSIHQIERTLLRDNCKEKRVELELHTKMTNMDGFVDRSSLLETLKNWGHNAIGITDTCCLQSLPDYYDSFTNNDIKILSGSELLLVEDEYRILTDLKGEQVYNNSKDFVVFDLETTGLSKYNDKITEIGAVRIKDGKIIDVFNELVNPECFIPEKIQGLTGITNEMVKDKETIDKILPRFLDFSSDSYYVGHNADFDIGFLRENAENLNLKFNPVYLDTLPLARALYPKMKNHKLDTLTKKLNVELNNHHRASDDATATAKAFIKMINHLKSKQEFDLNKINHIKTQYPLSKHESFSSLVFVKDKIGLNNLYKIISESRLKYFFREAKTPISVLNKYKQGLIIGSGGHEGLLFQALKLNYPKNHIDKLCDFFDFYQIEPLSLFDDEIEQGNLKDYDQIIDINKKIIELGRLNNKLVVATGGVRYLEKKDYMLRNILHKGQFSRYKENRPLYYLRSTNEMLSEFNYLDDDTRKEVVISNTNKIADLLNSIRPIPKGTFPPKIEGSDIKLRQTTYNKAREIYGDDLPEIVEKRLEKELNSIISNGYAVLYIIAQELVLKSNRDGYLVGSRGSVGSSFVATMADITEVNPLVPHYICPNCKYSEFITDGSYGAGIDLPDKKCPKCNHELRKDGHDIPFEVFLGFEGDKEPDIDLNFAGEYQPTIHKYTEEFFGKGKVFRAGTIGTIKSNTAYGYISKYSEENNIKFSQAQIRKFQRGLDDVKRTTGQHPGGLMIVPKENEIFEFSPIQYPADDARGDIKTTHFTYNMMHGVILKLDLLGHDVPSIIRNLQDLTNTNPLNIKMDDDKVMKIFSSTETLNIKHDFSNSDIGTLGIPEFGTNFVRGMLRDTYPKKFSEMTRISGLSHGTDVWLNNAQEIIKNKIADFDQIISTRDDIMNSLILKGLDKKKSFTIMEKVRKGKDLDEDTLKYMRENGVEDWYINSCLKIKYLFPKAHAVAYCLMSYRIAYYKVYYPEAFYATFFTTKLNDFEYSTIMQGLDYVSNTLKELNENNDLSQRDKNIKSVLELAEEMYARDIKILKADLYKSDATKFLIKDNKILPPLSAVDNVSEAMAKEIVKEREKSDFISKEDLKKRTCVNKNALNSLEQFNILDSLQEQNQISLFDSF